MERERVEIHGQKSSMVLDDFKELSVYDGGKKAISLPRSDKGHRNELEQLARLARGLPSSVISTEEVFSATELTFRVDEASRALQG
jgi:hypothetical protein